MLIFNYINFDCIYETSLTTDYYHMISYDFIMFIWFYHVLWMFARFKCSIMCFITILSCHQPVCYHVAAKLSSSLRSVHVSCVWSSLRYMKFYHVYHVYPDFVSRINKSSLLLNKLILVGVLICSLTDNVIVQIIFLNWIHRSEIYQPVPYC